MKNKKTEVQDAADNFICALQELYNSLPWYKRLLIKVCECFDKIFCRHKGLYSPIKPISEETAKALIGRFEKIDNEELFTELK